MISKVHANKTHLFQLLHKNTSKKHSQITLKTTAPSNINIDAIMNNEAHERQPDKDNIYIYCEPYENREM